MSTYTAIDEAAEKILDDYLMLRAMSHVCHKTVRLVNTSKETILINAGRVVEDYIQELSSAAHSNLASLALLGVAPGIRTQITEAILEGWARPNEILHLGGVEASEDFSELAAERYQEITGRPARESFKRTGFKSKRASVQTGGATSLLAIASAMLYVSVFDAIKNSVAQRAPRYEFNAEADSAFTTLSGVANTQLSQSLIDGVHSRQYRLSNFSTVERLIEERYDDLFEVDENLQGAAAAHSLRGTILSKARAYT